MAELIEGNVYDSAGRPVSGATVYIYDPTGELASLTDDADEAIDNPLTTGEDGYWSAYSTVEGFYTIRYFWAGRERLIESGRIVGRTPIEEAEDFAAAAEASRLAAGITTVTTISGTTHTLVIGNQNSSLLFTNAAGCTVTVPPNASVALAIGSFVELWQMGSGPVTVAEGSGVNVNSGDGLLETAGQYKGIGLRKIDTNEWLLGGALA